MKVKFIGDLHTEFWNFNKFEKLLEHYLPTTPEDKETILCCSGDMGLFKYYASTYKPLFKLLGQRFREVFVVSGNHSWYQSDIWDNEEVFWSDKKLPKNVHYLDDDWVIIDDVMFIGTTLWTDFDGENPVYMMYAKNGMSDFEVIRKKVKFYSPYDGEGYKGLKLNPEDTVVRHKKHVAFLEKTLQNNNGMKSVVITHHSPSSITVPECYAGNILNAAYVNSLENMILDYKPVVWAYGHQHNSFDEMLGETRLINNSLGYHAVDLNKKFNPDKVVEI
jgi:Icc-related predicted phosphoesterase